MVADDGKPIYDGYIVEVAGGAFVGAVPMNQCEPAPPVTDPRHQIQNVGVPVMRIMSQSDYLLGSASRRPDGDTRVDRFRNYEIAGAGHAMPDELYYSAAPADIERAGRPVPPMACNEGPRSRFPSSIHFEAAFRNFDLRVRHGVAPPHASPIAVENGAPVLDAFGNVTGGLRSPYVDVPTSRWLGSSDRRVVLLHRRPQAAVRPGDARAALPHPGRVRPRSGPQRGRADRRAVPHEGGRGAADPGGSPGRRAGVSYQHLGDVAVAHR